MLDQAAQRRMRQILDSLAELRIHDARILEVGCGTGWLSGLLTRFGTVTAVDLGQEIIGVAKERYPGVDFRSGDIHKLELPTHYFDVVVTLETFSHVPDQALFVRRLAELLKPGGMLLLTTQNKYVFDRRAGIPPNVGYIRKWVTMSTLRRMLRPEFVIRRSTTLEPEGQLGLLRIVNSAALNNVFRRTIGSERTKRLKERAGFGQTLFVIAIKR